MKRFLIFTFISFIALASYSQNKDSAQFYFKKGVEANSAKLYAVAAKDFDKVLHFNPDFTEAYIANGKVNLSMRMIVKAQENFSKAYELDPKNTEVISQLATLTFNNRQFQQAIELAQKCVNCDNASFILGMSYYNLQDYGKAEKYLKDAVAKDAKNSEAAYTLGRTYLELENEKSAIAQYVKAVQLEPTRSQCAYELGLIYYNQNDFKSALKYFDLAANNGYNKTNDFYENYGFAQLYAGDSENGIKTLNVVMEREPNNKELLNNIAHALYETKKYNDALNYFQKLLELNPKDAQSLYMCGMVLQKTGQKEKGQKLCDNAIAMDPSLNRYRQKNEMPSGL